jgi:hypothetical protein
VQRLDDLERKKSSAEIGPEHLTEVIRLLRKQYPNLSFGGSTHQGSGTHSGSGTGLTWDEVRQMMDEELERFSADRINMTDHALESTGARIMAQYTSSPYPSGFLASLKGRTGENPVVMLMVSAYDFYFYSYRLSIIIIIIIIRPYTYCYFSILYC